MPWRLIVFIILFLAVFLLMVFNLDNKTEINFGFTKLENISVFVTAFFSFLAGMLFTLPFIFRKRKKPGEITVKMKGKGLLAKAAKKQGDSTLVDKSNYGID